MRSRSDWFILTSCCLLIVMPDAVRRQRVCVSDALRRSESECRMRCRAAEESDRRSGTGFHGCCRSPRKERGRRSRRKNHARALPAQDTDRFDQTCPRRIPRMRLPMLPDRLLRCRSGRTRGKESQGPEPYA